MKDSEQRGSLEETRRILQEIERINLSLGYKKRMTLAFPRVASGEGYFYPRQQFRPEFLTRPRENFNQNAIRMNNQRAIYPFNNQNYFYPTPYLQVPVDEKIHAFKSNKYFYPLVYAPINVMPYDYEKFKDDKEADGSIRLGTIVVLPSDESSERESKALESSRKAEATKKPESLKKSGRGKPKAEQSESSLIDQIVNYVPDALGLSDDDDDDAQDERQEIVIVSTTRLPIIKNDKYLNLALKKNQQEVEEDEENRKLPPPLPSNVNRAFNFSNPIEKLQNFTKQFTVSPTENLKEVTMVSSTASPDDIEDAAFDKAEIKEDEKSPFGFAFGPKQQLQTYKEGGLIIQRLRVRTGGIAIAGPGGVATVINSQLINLQKYLKINFRRAVAVQRL